MRPGPRSAHRRAARFDAWLRELGEPAAPAALGAEPGGFRPPSGRAARSDPRRAGAPDCWLLSGPEGGLAPEEEAAALRRGFVPVSLGPRTLRADTAPLALLAWLGLADRRRHE